MLFIKNLFKKYYPVITLIAICIFTDLLISYSQGWQREYIANQAYFNFINNYPDSIQSVRVEPLFITILYYTTKISNALFSVIVLKTLLTVIQLFIFYKILILLNRDKLLASFFTIILNFSFAFFSLQDNLLRNHFANTIFLIALYFLLETLKYKNSNWLYILTTSIFGGILIYSHILPTLLFNLTLITSFLIIIILLLLTTIFKQFYQHKHTLFIFLKNIFLIGSLVLLIQIPYILKFYHVHTSINDYKQVGEVTSNKKTYIDNKQTTSNNLQDIIKNIKNHPNTSLISLFRILFEFRLPGISLFFMFAIVASLLYTLKKQPLNNLLLIYLWFLTYIGTKLDILFGIGVLSYRFSLMLIFPSILTLSILTKKFINLIQNKTGQFFVMFLITISFLSINLPIIFNISLFRNYQPNYSEIQTLKNIDQQIKQLYQKPKHIIFLINGKSFEKFDKTATYLRNIPLFTSSNENNIIKSCYNNNIDFIIFDHFRINEKGSDINTTINTNLKIYENSNYFKKIEETITPYLHLSIFQFTPDHPLKNTIASPTKEVFNCDNHTICLQKLNARISQLNITAPSDWIIDISVKNHAFFITEFITTTTNQLEISYSQPINSSSKNKLLIKLLNIPTRQKVKPYIILHIPNAQTLLKYTGFVINRLELQKSSINELTIFGQIDNDSLSILYLSINQIKILSSLISLSLILILYTILAIINKKTIRTSKVLLFNNARNKNIVMSILAFIIIDMIILNSLFIQLYKLLLHLK